MLFHADHWAPASSRLRTSSELPESAAACKGVMPPSTRDGTGDPSAATPRRVNMARGGGGGGSFGRSTGQPERSERSVGCCFLASTRDGPPCMEPQVRTKVELRSRPLSSNFLGLPSSHETEPEISGTPLDHRTRSPRSSA